MFQKSDIVRFKITTSKWYTNVIYKVMYVNKKDNKVWVRPFEGGSRYFYWKLNPDNLVKIEQE